MCSDGLERFLHTVRQASADERDDDYRSEYRIRLDNGAQRWVETRGQPFFGRQASAPAFWA